MKHANEKLTHKKARKSANDTKEPVSTVQEGNMKQTTRMQQKKNNSMQMVEIASKH